MIWGESIDKGKLQLRLARFLLLGLLITIAACQTQSQQPPKETEKITNSVEEERLVLKNATLEQSDDEGNILWQIEAQQAVYSDDKQTAQLQDLKGKLFRKGEVVLQVTAKEGEIHDNGEKIFLRHKIVATDPRNSAVIRGEEIEWIPEDDVLIVSKNLTGSNEQVQAAAKSGKYFTSEQLLELKGQIVATTKEPNLQMKTEFLSWEVANKKVRGNQKIQIDRFEDKTITDRIVADKSEVNLETKVAVLQNNVDFKSLEPLVQIATNSAIWNVDARTVLSDQPVRIVHHKESLTLTANEGIADLKQEIVRLKGGVQGISQRNKGNLYANQLTWEIPTQIVRAQGNIIYRQTNPNLDLKGAQAVGRLQDETLVVTGGSNTRVVTEIIP